MRKTIALSAVICLNIAAGSASAQPAGRDSALEACVGIASDKDRLTCYDTAMGRAQQSAATSDLPAQKPTVTPEEAFGSESLRRPKEVREAEQSQTLDATIEEILTAARGELVLILNNGQIWRQNEATSLPPLKVGDPVVIKRGLIGSYRMTLKKQHRTINVRRIK
ncbi:MAG: hypothetical protein E6R12_00465 [Sphingomonadales bacterium]|nr:MAG: hypothetical protein E6R12_00465 [Sphingomonadales bacterium]